MVDEDDSKSMRSKKSQSVYSSMAKSIRKQGTLGQKSVVGSPKNGSKRERQMKPKKEDLPVPTKLDLQVRQLHSDNLSE